MSQKYIASLFLASSILFLSPSSTQAVEIITGEISGDEEYAGGVVLENATAADTSRASATIEGTGSLTVYSQIGGGFPRMQLIGGTTINSVRNWGSSGSNAEAWSGQLAPPATTRTPDPSSITFAAGDHSNSEIEPIATYTWGLSNETFTYSPNASLAFSVKENDGQKIWFAQPSGEGWSIQETAYCIVQNEVCVQDMQTASTVTLVKELFTQCPRPEITNGTVGPLPICKITCDRDYLLNAAGTGCESVFGEEDTSSSTSSAPAETTGSTESTESMTEESFNSSAYEEDSVGFMPAMPEKEYKFVPGYFRYRDSAGSYRRYLPEESLEGDDQDLAQHNNVGFKSRNGRSAEEQFAAQEASRGAGNAKMTPQQEDSFLNYMLSMRDSFAHESPRVETLSASAGDSSEGNEDGMLTAKEESKSAGNLYSSGGKPMLLPAAGPEIFITIAIMGVLLMLFGTKRRN